MVPARGAVDDGWDAMLERERPQLVLLCAHLTGDAAAAEDLAQETLLEAWRHRRKLHESEGHVRWLRAIARHVCRRRARTRTRELAHQSWAHQAGEGPIPAPEEDLAAECNVEVELERDELARLLGRALDLLPPETRLVLVQKYRHGYSEAEIAAGLGVRAGAVEARLHRGKLALRRILATDLRQDAAAYGLLVAPDSEWQETRIWCPVCGQRRLVGRSFARHGEFRLRCPGCFPAYHSASALNIVQATSVEAIGGVKGFKPALSRIMADWDSFFRRACAAGHGTCPVCAHSTVLRTGIVSPTPDWPASLSTRQVHWRCERCGAMGDLHLLSLTLYGPIGRRFWQTHPRLRMLPEREIEINGRPALLTRFESLTGQATLEVVSAHDTYEVLHTTTAQV